MPRKTKDQNEIEKKQKTKKVKEETVLKTSTAKKSSIKETKTKKPITSKKVASSKAKTSKKTISTKSKKVLTSTTKKKSLDKTKTSEVLEYYDLPYRYNQTVVKLLAQTPDTLFIYWDISNKDRKNFEKQYGENFFENTKPVLIVYNDTLNYHFEVVINDFANSWYLHIADSKCEYRVELGRRPIKKDKQLNIDYIYVSSSNEIEAPNDSILINKEQKMVYFRNTKTGKEEPKTISFIQNMGKIYNIYDVYQEIYKEEELQDITNPSSTFK